MSKSTFSMKRPRSSYGDDLDEDAWPRRDSDPDRPPAHHHRRYSSHSSSSKPHPNVPRKGGAGPPPTDDVRGPPLSSVRKRRFDYELDGFDRRKPGSGGFDRCRDSGAGDRAAAKPVSSSLAPPPPRGSCGGDRMYYRSVGFSVLRRDFPKGFRSEGDRSRREGGGGSGFSSGSSWRRSSRLKEPSSSFMPAAAAITADAATDEAKKSLLSDSESAERRSLVGSLEDHRGKARSRDTSSGKQRSSRTESVMEERPSTESCNRESCSDDEIEEGELEPDLEPEQQQPVAEPSVDAKTFAVEPAMENCEGRDLQSNIGPETTPEKKKKLRSMKLVSDGGNDADGKNEAKSEEIVFEQPTSVQMVRDSHHHTYNDGKEKNEVEGEEVQANNYDEVAVKLRSDKQELVQREDNNSSLPCQSREVKYQEAGEEVIEEREKVSSSPSLLQQKEPEQHAAEARFSADDAEASHREELREEPGMSLEVDQKEQRGIDLELEPDGVTGLCTQRKRVVSENNCERLTLKLMIDKPKDDYKVKGKIPAISVSSLRDYVENGAADEGPSGIGFDLFSGYEFSQNEKAQASGICNLKHEDDNLKIETLDLSLSLPCASSDHPPKHLKHKPYSPNRVSSIQSLPSSFRTSSGRFTTISFSSSQPFVHNPSCSFTQNSLDNHENSVGSHPIFQGIDHVPNGSIRQVHNTNETKPKEILHETLVNGSASQTALHNLNSQHQSKPNGLLRQSNLSRQFSPACSQGSHDSRSNNNKDKRLLLRERSSSSLFRSENREAEQFAVSGAGVTEKILSKVVAEPLSLNGRMLQNMTENSIAYLKETICEMLMHADKTRQLCAFQDALQGRSDLTMDVLAKCPKILLEILVALQTGLPSFLQRENNISPCELVEIFLNLRCRNLACRSVLPVDDCDCKICIQKSGFCSACMCLVCRKFDNASNTCSWVGCDECRHWCHTDCGLCDSHIKNGKNASEDKGTGEMQFHCIACNHPSEMFGFVKEVFKTCAKDWKADTLAKELQYVRRIFSLSNDVRGKRLCYVAELMLDKLEKKANISEVGCFIMAFLSDSDSGINSNLSVFQAKESNQSVGIGGKDLSCSSKVGTWLQSVPSEKVSLADNAGLISSIDRYKITRKTKDAESQLNLEKKPAVVELESVVRFKQAEAIMYQERADAARREAEGLKRIAKSKNDKIEEDYGDRIARLRMAEAEERRRQRLEELQAIEKTHREFFNMKIRVETNIKELLVRMEATRLNSNT